MFGWQELSQQLLQLINSVIRFVKIRRREHAAVGIAAILFWIGNSFPGWLPKNLENFIASWSGDLIIPGVFFLTGFIFLSYGFYRIWKLVFVDELPAVSNSPSAIKGTQAFTSEDGDLFRKLGREEELRKLLSYIEDDQVSLVVLMGASGAGKTSLLRAGLTDIIKGKNIKYHYWEAVPSDSGQNLLRAIQQNLDNDLSVSATKIGSIDDLINLSSMSSNNRHVIVLDQFEQLAGAGNNQVFQMLRKVIRKTKPPFNVTWVIAFRREFRAEWSDFMIPEHERGFFPSELSLRLFTAEQARDVTAQLVQAAGLLVEQKVVNNLIEAATVEGEVSSVDIGIGMLVLSELFNRQGGKTVTEDEYHFAGEAEGLLTQYISRCFDYFSEADRETLLHALLALRNAETNQRIATGKTCTELAEEAKADNRRLETQLNRLTQRDIRLLERVAATEDDIIRYRLPHERLIPALNRLAGKIIGELEEAKLKFISAFSAWRNNNSSQHLLRGKVLRLVERFQNQISWGKEEQEKLDFLKRSQRRRTRGQIISVALIISLLLGGWIAYLQYQRYEARRYLSDNNYPPELYDYQHQLKGLELMEPLNLKYLPFLNSTTLEELIIKATTSTNSLEGLADSFTKCTGLKKLSLDLSDSQVQQLPSLPNSLTKLSLNLSNSQVQRLPSLPNSLTELSLYLNDSQAQQLPDLQNSNCKTLKLFGLSTTLKMSLKMIPKSVTYLAL